eukprot:RCo054832
MQNTFAPKKFVAPRPPVGTPIGIPTPPLAAAPSGGQDVQPNLSVINIPNFKLGNFIGQGSCTVVHKCMELGTKVVLAVKTGMKNPDDTKKDLDKESNSALLFIEHDNVVKTHHILSMPAQVHIIMEYMNGGSLAVLITRRSALEGANPGEGLFPENVLSCIARQIGSGLLCLHKNKIIHRDLKPSNVLINSHGQVKVTDFGCSKYLLKTGQVTSTKIGSEEYMSPERVRGEDHTEKADVWSLGVTLAECVLGVFPLIAPREQPSGKFGLSGRLKEGVAAVNFTEAIAQLQELGTQRVPSLPSDRLRNFVELCMKQNPAERPACQELLTHSFITTDSGLTTTAAFRDWLKAQGLTKNPRGGTSTAPADAVAPTTASSSSSSSSSSASGPTPMEF